MTNAGIDCGFPKHGSVRLILVTLGFRPIRRQFGVIGRRRPKFHRRLPQPTQPRLTSLAPDIVTLIVHQDRKRSLTRGPVTLYHPI